METSHVQEYAGVRAYTHTESHEFPSPSHEKLIIVKLHVLLSPGKH